MSSRPKKSIKEVVNLLDKKLTKEEKGTVIPFNQFLQKAGEEPLCIFRTVFQLFNNMIYHYITMEGEGKPDPESINYRTVNCDRLLVDDTDTPFFSDLPLANRIIRLADSFREGAQQNKIYIFVGPPGSGKSTFINNLLRRFQEYTHLQEGTNYEVLWRLDETKLGPRLSDEIKVALEDYYKKFKGGPDTAPPNIFEVPCPSHDHPFLLIPPDHRKEVLENLLNGAERTKIFNKKEYDWLFKDLPCTICTSIYQALIKRLESPIEVFNMLFAKRYFFDRRLGNGISVYNPGDRDSEKFIYSNDVIQRELAIHFKDSNIVKYVYSKYAKTNNGVYVIMDVKGYNEKRFLDLHGIISEGTHKIEEVEENVNSLFIAVMNPEDKGKIATLESFKDRIKEINVNYILNYTEEVKIYFSSFGKQIQNRFLPGVLNNFAQIIISSRLNPESATIKEWIDDPLKYRKYSDENLLLLKLSIYNNKIPGWLEESDYNKFDKKLRRKLIDESEAEGRYGFSGRESINIFNEFYNSVRKKLSEEDGTKRELLITMNDIKEFFEKHKDYISKIPQRFIDSIIRLYDYNVMQQIKESLFQQNEERISKDIQNYLFALNYDAGERLISPYTKETFEISDSFYYSIESNLFNSTVSDAQRKKFRDETASKFTINLQEMQVSNSSIENTHVYKELYNTYMKNLRENIFQPFLQYTSFENAIKSFGTDKFNVYDTRTIELVNHLIKNLISKFHYSEDGAKQVCLYIINNKITQKLTE